jgi:thiamine-phosphate pyrophosphorylase
LFPRLYPIVDTAVSTRSKIPPTAIAEALLDAGVQILQYRHKGPFTRSRYEEAESIATLCSAKQVAFVMNDRADLARLLNAGLHIGQDDLPFDAVRRILPDQPIGFSTHNPAQFAAAPAAAGYVAYGPVFATGSKENPDPVVGLDGLAQAAATKRKHQPLVAIGGIALESAPSVWKAGADSIAVISALVPEGATPSTIREIAKEWLSAASMV